ncbi:MAG TPA: polymer-forming cytoskeletal protein [Saprospiraceae bacterium]|nr:polymer-forming cytoskeletal protein [Saprospiraceae bacterium]
MFGSKKEPSSRPNNIIPSATSHALNSIVQGSSVVGDIRADSDIRIDGMVKGTLVCKAKVIIGPTGMIEGEVKCQNAVIEGRLKGVLTVEDLLHVKETAEIDGRITTGKIIVQSGALFNVNCQMGAHAKSNGAIKSTQEQKQVVQSAVTA